MKTQTNKISKLLFTALASLVLMNTACQKKNDSPPPPPPPPPVCTVQPCVNGIPGVGGQLLYSGTASSYAGTTQAQFQVSGDVSGNGMGQIAGSVTFNNWVCQVGQPNLSGGYTMQPSQQGYLQSDVFTGTVMLVGPQGSIPATVKVVPTRTQGIGLFSLFLNQCQSYYPIDMNF